MINTQQPDVEMSGCGYQGYEFGTNYPDSICYEGRLWDADDCDGNGMIYEPLDWIPCPMCHPFKYIQYLYEQTGSDETFLGKIHSMYCAVRLTLDILKNRIMGTEPWKNK